MPKIQLEVNARFSGHKDAVFTVIRGTEENSFITAGGDGYIVSWNLHQPEEGKLLARVPQPVYSLLLPGSGKLLAGCSNGSLYLFDLENAALLKEVKAHRGGIFDLHLRNNQVWSMGEDGMLKLWSWPELEAVREFQISEKSLRHAVVHGDVMAIASSDHRIHLLHPETLERKNILQGHTNSVFSVAFLNETQLLSGGRDAMLRSWNPETGEMQTETPAHWFHINHIALSPDGRYFATVSLDKTLKIWDASNMELLKVGDLERQGGHTSSINRLLWINSQQLITVSDDRQVLAWKISGEPGLGV